MVARSSAELGSDSTARVAIPPGRTSTPEAAAMYAEQLPTVNPSAEQIRFEPRAEAAAITERLSAFVPGEEPPPNTIFLDLAGALAYATMHSREHRFAQEEYVLAAMRLLIERHLWGPRFFNDVSAIVSSQGQEGFFDTAAQIINEFTVSQRLPYGGEVAISALASATADLHSRIRNGSTQAAELVVSADVPLLRGAGQIAREDRIQAERELIYAARQYEQFRREFHFDIAQSFLNLVVQRQAIENAQRGVESLEWLERRSEAFVATGRETPIDLALTQQQTLFARDRLNAQIEAYRLALDRFKVRIGMPSDQPIAIVESDPGLPVPEIGLEEAVSRALAYRLDIQTVRDRIDDARRGVVNARNLLLPDLNIFGTVSVPTSPNRRYGGIGLRPGESFIEGGVTLGLPLDREIERLNVRQAQLELERRIREYEEFRDSLAVETRGSVRAIDQAMFSLQIQEENVRIAERARDAIRADPDRATARDRTEAVDQLLQAQNERDAARRDLQVAILQYLLFSGQLRIAPDGTIEPLLGMNVAGG